MTKPATSPALILHDLPAAEYHATPLLTSGGLRDFIRSPQLYRDRMDGLIPQQEDSDARKFGRVFHLAVLEPGKFNEGVVRKPEGMSFATKEGKAWRDENTGKEIISDKDATRVDSMMARMPAEARTMLSSGVSEVTIRCDIAGIPAQCRPDHWDAPGNMMYDLKTINAIEKVEREIWKWRYDIQVQFYRRMIEIATGRLPTARLVFAESVPPYRWRIVQLDVDLQMMADEAIETALAGIAACERAGKWEDPEELHLVASPPSWAIDDGDNNEEE